MSAVFDLVLRNGTVVLPSGVHRADIGVRDGKTAGIGVFGSQTSGETIDCTGLHILPGVIDTQVHFRDPGMTHKEDLETGTMAAAAGGVTAVFEMPNTDPLTTTPEAVAAKLERAAQVGWVDHAFYLGGTVDNARHLPEWENLPGICGIKIFMGASTGALLSATDEEVDAILGHGRRIVAIHAEDESIMNENKKTILKDSHDVRLHPLWRSPESCLSATRRAVRLARRHGRRVHILHITTAEEIAFLRGHKDIASAEILVNHLTLSAPECYDRLGTRAQQNPPVREKAHQDALWAAIADGTADILATDHAPHTAEEKSKPYPASPSGMPGVQTLVPVMLNHVHEGRLTLERFVDLTAHGPQRLFGMAGKGRIAAGYDADFTVVDLKETRTLTNAAQKSRSGWTPFDGMAVTGWPKLTIVRGRVVMRDDALLGPPAGKPVRFRETLAHEGAL
ncbi:MAG: dihydroorotase [Rhodospirillales bacterium]|nr:dihydroorotase [Rhodospirillales bacterium]